MWFWIVCSRAFIWRFDSGIIEYRGHIVLSLIWVEEHLILASLCLAKRILLVSILARGRISWNYEMQMKKAEVFRWKSSLLFLTGTRAAWQVGDSMMMKRRRGCFTISAQLIIYFPLVYFVRSKSFRTEVLLGQVWIELPANNWEPNLLISWTRFPCSAVTTRLNLP